MSYANVYTPEEAAVKMLEIALAIWLCSDGEELETIETALKMMAD